MLTGKVELGNEKSNKELETLYKEQISTLTSQLETTQTEHKKLQIKYTSSLKKHSYHKFKEIKFAFIN